MVVELEVDLEVRLGTRGKKEGDRKIELEVDLEVRFGARGKKEGDRKIERRRPVRKRKRMNGAWVRMKARRRRMTGTMRRKKGQGV